MKSTGYLCPRCQRPLAPNEMYCSWCNGYSPDARPNTTGSFPPPYPQYAEIPYQSWPPTSPIQDMPGEKIAPPPQSPSGRKKLNKFFLIGSTLVVCLLLAASFWFGRSFATNSNPSTKAVTSLSTVPATQAAPTSNVTTPPAQVTATSAVPSPSPQATATSNAPLTSSPAHLSSPQLPLTIPCVSCPYPQLTMALNTITVDQAGQLTNWSFTISNSGRNSCSSLSFYSLQLIDPYGTTYQGKGQAANHFAMGSGQSLQVNAVFELLPSAKTQYALKLEVYVGYCNLSNSGSVNAYTTENFMFA